MTRWSLGFAVLVGLLAQASGYLQVGNPLGTLGLLVFSCLWFLAGWRKWSWFSSLYLGIMLLAAVIGVMVWEIPFAWNLIGLLGAILAWDLEAFSRRLALAAEDDDYTSLERSHLAQLAGFSGLAVFLVSGARLFTLRIPFGWSFWLVVLLAITLTRVVLWLRRRGQV